MPLTKDDLIDLGCILRDISEELDRLNDLIEKQIQRLVSEANIIEEEV